MSQLTDSDVAQASKAAVWLALAVAAACAPAPVPVEIPPDTRTLVWILPIEGAPVGRVDNFPGVHLGTFAAGSPSLLLTYPKPAAELGLKEGALLFDPSGELLPVPATYLAMEGAAVRAANAEELSAVRAYRVLQAKVPCAECLELQQSMAQRKVACVECPGPIEPAAPVGPSPPLLPDLRPCPSGWALAGGGGQEFTCLAPGALSCGAAEVPSDGACAPLSPCGPGPFPAELPGAVHVDPTAAPGGDGSRAAPFLGLDQALAVVPDGGVLLLSAGRHPGPIDLDRRITVLGLCPAQTTLSGPITVRSASVALGGVSAGGGITVGSVGGLSAQGVWVTGAGIAVSGAADLRRVVIEGAGGPGIEVGPSARLQASDLWIRGRNDAAILGRAQAQLQVTRLFVDGGAGLVLAGAHLVLGAGVLRGITGPGIQVGPDGELDGQDLMISGASAEALLVERGRLTVSRIQLEDSGAAGLRVEDGDVQAEHWIIRRPGWRGLELQRSTARLGRGLIEDPAALANFFGAKTTQLTDLTIRAASSAEEGLVLYGLGPYQVSRVQIDGAKKNGLVMAGKGTLEDLDIRGITQGSPPAMAKGVAVRVGGNTFRRVKIRRVEGLGFDLGLDQDDSVWGGATSLEDLDVEDCEEGISLQREGDITMDRTRVVDVTLEGVEVGNAVATGAVRLSNLTIQSAGLRSNINGALLIEDAPVRLEQALILDAGRGVLLRRPAGLEARAAVIERAVVGATVAPTGPRPVFGLVFRGADSEIDFEE